MFNVFAYQKRLKELQIAKPQDKDQTNAQLQANRVYREKLAKRYKQRVQNFIKKMTEDPIVQKDYYKIDLEKQKQTAKFKGDRIMRFSNFKTEKQRISDALKQQSTMDSAPIRDHVLHLRPRQRQKEIGPQFRYKARDKIERVVDQINRKGFGHFTDVEVTGATALELQQSAKQIQFSGTTFCQKKEKNEIIQHAQQLSTSLIAQEDSFQGSLDYTAKIAKQDSKNHLEIGSLFDQKDEKRANMSLALSSLTKFDKTQTLLKGSMGQTSSLPGNHDSSFHLFDQTGQTIQQQKEIILAQQMKHYGIVKSREKNIMMLERFVLDKESQCRQEI